MRRFFPFLCASFILTSIAQAESKALVIHEWGTFTSLQDEQGRSIGGLNSDDEPLPPFVHRLWDGLIAGDFSFSKGIPPLDPDVTMRLETPVMYFYPPDQQPMTIDVAAKFNGGYLTEFYPNAEKTQDEQSFKGLQAGITANTHGGLTWRNVRLAANPYVPSTPSHVWLAPRAVKAVSVSVDNEVERYIFYRGVGHLDPPIRVCRSGDEITLFEQGVGLIDWPGIWLADFRGDGSCAFREIKSPPSAVDDAAAAIPATFKASDYAIQNVSKLKNAMKLSLVKAGLFDDEADAMLETWKLSYFKSNGERLFFLVPRFWTDRTLPLNISTKCELTRVMMGRIELLTPSERETIETIASAARPEKQLDALYAQLGRFNGAMILDELRRKPTDTLRAFAKAHYLATPAPTVPESRQRSGLSSSEDQAHL